MLITHYFCKTLSNCMLEDRRPYFRSLDRGYIDCDPKWCCVDVHEARIVFRGDVTTFVGLATWIVINTL